MDVDCVNFQAAATTVLLALLQASCTRFPAGITRASASAGRAQRAAQRDAGIPVWSASVIATYRHDPRAFTQGLEFHGGYLYESTGIAGQSTLRRVKVETGEIVSSVALPGQYFGEGLTIFHGKIYQLTWLAKLGFIYDLQTLKRVGEFRYDTEGWGLAHDEKSLIMSDGSNELRFLDPSTFRVNRVLEVYAGAEAVPNLNELEFVDGKIYANIWHSVRIAVIDSGSGQVIAWINLAALAENEGHGAEDVLNGIAYDRERRRLFVTGKNWGHLFEIKVSKQKQ